MQSCPLCLCLLNFKTQNITDRDDAYAELATAYADMDALHATLTDSAVYVRYLRKRVLELELEQSRSAARSLLGQWDATPQPAATEGKELSIEPPGHCWGRVSPRCSPSGAGRDLSPAIKSSL